MCGHSWRVPLSAGTGRYTVVVWQPRAEGARDTPAILDSDPVEFDWRWYHAIPGVPCFVILITLILIVRQAIKAASGGNEAGTAFASGRERKGDKPDH